MDPDDMTSLSYMVVIIIQKGVELFLREEALKEKRESISIREMIRLTSCFHSCLVCELLNHNVDEKTHSDGHLGPFHFCN